MPTIPQSEFPIPKSWDEFEDIVWGIYSHIWENSNVQRYGRSGQAQEGVDIYGQPKYLNGGYAGIQCKRYKDGNLSKTKIEAEIAKAEQFSPPLAEYIIATTEHRDVNLQKAVRDINENRRLNGKFTITIVFWEDLSSKLGENRGLLEKHYGDWVNRFRQVPPQATQIEIQNYISHLSELLLNQGLREADPTDDVSVIARINTLLLLENENLPGEQKVQLIQHLYMAKLLSSHKPAIDLYGANLRNIDLNGLDLRDINLGGTDLQGANLSKTNLSGADLGDNTPALIWKTEDDYRIGANLSGANLSNANLSGAFLGGVKLNGANLEGANLNGTYLGGAQYDKTTIWPNNFELPSSVDE